MFAPNVGFGPGWRGGLGMGGNRRSLEVNQQEDGLNPGPEHLSALSDVTVRHGFIKKVYGILGAQLSLTCILAAGIIAMGKSWVHQADGLAISMICLSSMGSVAMMFVFICCPDVLRRSPLNYLVLFGFTVCKAVLVGFICLGYTQESVLIAVAITAFITVSLTLFAHQTTYDFSGFAPYIFCGVMCMMGLSFAFMIAHLCGLGGSPAMQWMRLLYAACGALLFSFYIVFDTQLIVGGKHNQYRFGVDDYAMAAINIYIDIIQLFIFLLQLFGKRR